MAEDTEKVQSIVNEVLKEHSAVTPVTTRLDRCLATVIGRRKGKSKDIVLAAVDHYFFARHAVAEGGSASYALMVGKVPAYEWVKFLPWGRWILETGNKILGDPDPSVSPASILSVQWGLRGANHGWSDYAETHADELEKEFKRTKEF